MVEECLAEYNKYSPLDYTIENLEIIYPRQYTFRDDFEITIRGNDLNVGIPKFLSDVTPVNFLGYANPYVGGSQNGRKPLELVRECPEVECPGHPLRMGKNPFDKRNLTEAQRKAKAALISVVHFPDNLSQK